MQYKTIVLQLLKDRTQWYEQLRLARLVLSTMETLAAELKAGQQAWEKALAKAKPDSLPQQLQSEAMEIALEELQARLPPVSPMGDEIPLDQAMAFLKIHTPSG